MSFETRLEIIWHVQLTGPIIHLMPIPFALVALTTIPLTFSGKQC